MPLPFVRPRRDIPSALPDGEAEEFLEGWCHLFAGALNRLTGWPVVVLRDPNPPFVSDAYSHAHFLVEAPDGLLWDAAGGATPQTVLAFYPWIRGARFERVGDEAAIRGNPHFGATLRAYHDGFLPEVEAIAGRGILPLLRERYPSPGDGHGTGEIPENGFRMR